MTFTQFAKPSDLATPLREAGGDNEVPRDGLGRPRIIIDCWLCDGTGRVTNQKTGNLNKCQGCGPKKNDPATENLPMGKRLKAYTRTTTYIDVLDDKSNLMAWDMRMVLIGVARDQRILNDVLTLDLTREEKESKDALNRKAQVAKLKAGAEEKADKGTHLHGLSELIDQGLPLPGGTSFEDVLDMDAYRVRTKGFKIVHMEQLMVCHDLGVAGTPDRVSEWFGAEPLVAPDGHVFEPGSGELLITDLKTGTVAYGALKMAMQLGLYSHSRLYDKESGETTPLGNINQKWGVIMNVPAGSGECELYWADLELGWEAVQLAGQVRKMRGRAGGALTAFTA